jgi:hypothetical protein
MFKKAQITDISQHLNDEMVFFDLKDLSEIPLLIRVEDLPEDIRLYILEESPNLVLGITSRCLIGRLSLKR